MSSVTLRAIWTSLSMDDAEKRFTEAWHAYAPRVLAYARRHVGAEADEVVADTFLVAWRRWDSVPDPLLPWLIGTARKVIQGRSRSLRRHDALTSRLARLEQVAAVPGDSVEAGLQRREALGRLAALDLHHREALLLVSWDGLTTDQAARVLDIRPATFRRRLSRARLALERRDATPLLSSPSLRPIQETA